jgi:ADP-heptose:LPS heptosyltransferase
MLEKTRMNVGVVIARFHFRKTRDPIVQFTNAISRARKALILWPESASEAPYVQSILRSLSQRLGASALHVLVRKDLAKFVSGSPTGQVMMYDKDDVNTWFFPRKGLLQKVKKSTFDVVVDLNVHFALPSAVLCKETHAPLRVSFGKPHADVFYNLQIQTGETVSTINAYKHLLRYLEMF